MNEKRNALREELEAELPHFTGTEEYHRLRYPWLRKEFLLTDGAKYLADKAAAYWLMDLIASHQPNKKVATEGFQTWRLYVQGDKPDNKSLPPVVLAWKKKARPGEAIITCDDGNGNILVTQKIQYTDFPLAEIKLYVTNDDFNGIVVMLPSEY
jgi:hypothetical protein